MLLLIFSKELELLLCHLDVLVPEFSSSYPQVQLGNHMAVYLTGVLLQCCLRERVKV